MDKRPKGLRKVPEPAALEERRLRAVSEPLDVRWRSESPFVWLEVRNPVHKTAYTALFPSFPERLPALCTCTDFARRGLGDCKHLEAAWTWLHSGSSAERRPPPSPLGEDAAEVWRRVDLAQHELSTAKPASTRDLARVGHALIERPVRID